MEKSVFLHERLNISSWFKPSADASIAIAALASAATEASPTVTMMIR